ncbi:MAG: YqeG family HAD IIIA-type phosphatase [Chloroflexota bacterium]
MLETLRPKLYLESIYRVDPDMLAQRGIRGLILDIDNTLVPWNDPIAPEKLLRWLEALRAAGISACLMSNNTPERVSAFAKALGVPWIVEGRKPAARAYHAALAVLGTRAGETAALGDQIYPDVVGANRMGIFSILVVPLSEREFVGTRVKRILERPLLRAMVRWGWIARQ